MPKKTAVTKNSVYELESCIKDCEDKLAKACEKAIDKYQKDMLSIKKKEQKQKQKLNDIKSKYDKAAVAFKTDKKSTSKQRMLKAESALLKEKKELAKLKEEQTCIKVQLKDQKLLHKKWSQRQKLIDKFEKMWIKAQLKKEKKSAKKRKSRTTNRKVAS